MKNYYFWWIDEKLEVEPSMKGAPIVIEAADPETAWNTFHNRYPKLRDGEGDYYVRITETPHGDDELAEAGVKKNGQAYFQYM